MLIDDKMNFDYVTSATVLRIVRGVLINKFRRILMDFMLIINHDAMIKWTIGTVQISFISIM